MTPHVLGIIAKKREGLALPKKEIEFFVRGLMQGEIRDYQSAAWLMACDLQRMNMEETAHLTYATARSGGILDMGDIAPLAVDRLSVTSP